MLLFIDTETTGFFNFDLPIDHPSQPHLVSLAAWLGYLNADCVPQHVASLNAVLKPVDWPADYAVHIHRITRDYARSFGEDLSSVLSHLHTLITEADDDEGWIIAHNLSFDQRILLSAFARDKRDPTFLNLLRPFCTMKALTPRMRLPARHPGKFKWPKLSEAFAFCFPDRIFSAEDQHTAMGDLLACRDIYCHGRQQEWW